MKLPPLPDEAFDGERITLDLSKHVKCTHFGKVTQSNPRQIRCKCGAAWEGMGIERLLEAFNAPKPTET